MDSHFFQQKNEKIVIAAGVVCLALIVLAALFLYSKKQYIKIDDIKSPIGLNQTHANPFSDIGLSAHAAIVWNAKENKIIFQKNRKDILPLASLTKLMTALAAMEILPERSTIRIAKDYLEIEKNANLLANEQWRADDLISLTLLASSNTGAGAIASVAGAFLSPPSAVDQDPRALFVKYLNKRAAELGLESLRFYNDSGLDIDPEKGGAYGNVEDAAKLMALITQKYPELLEATTHADKNFRSTDNTVHKIKNTNETVENIAGVMGSKTGFTDLAGGNLAVAFSPGLEGPYVAVVLGSTFDGRFSDIEKLVDATLRLAPQTPAE